MKRNQWVRQLQTNKHIQVSMIESSLFIEVMQASKNQYLPRLKNIEDEVGGEEEESSCKETSVSI